MEQTKTPCSGQSFDGRFYCACRRPSKGIGLDGKPYCGRHLAGLKRQAANLERGERKRNWAAAKSRTAEEAVRRLREEFPDLKVEMLYRSGLRGEMGWYDASRVIVDIESLRRVLTGSAQSSEGRSIIDYGCCRHDRGDESACRCGCDHSRGGRRP